MTKEQPAIHFSKLDSGKLSEQIEERNNLNELSEQIEVQNKLNEQAFKDELARWDNDTAWTNRSELLWIGLVTLTLLMLSLSVW